MQTPENPAGKGTEEATRDRLSSSSTARRMRRLWRMLPGGPRCKLCTSPFGPPVGPLLRLIGKGRWHGNPAYCAGCFRELYTHRRGAEVECTLLFADARGSTALAERMGPAAFRGLMDRFYTTASEILIRHEAVIDKFVGDEVVAIFVPAMAGQEHAASAVAAGLDLLRATLEPDASPWIPIGIGINTGVAYVGAVGTADHVEFTALGDAVNVTARLASAAGPGELLVTNSAAKAAGLDVASNETRRLALRGKSEETDALVLTAATAAQQHQSRSEPS